MIRTKKGGNKFVGTHYQRNARAVEGQTEAPMISGLIARTAEGKLVPMPQINITTRPRRTRGTV